MKRALLIASNAFAPDSGIEPLRFPLNDIDAIERTLRSEDFNFEIDKLVNPTSSEALRSLGQWISKADYDDLVLIYYSGHGKLSRARELYLSCADTNNNNLIFTALKYTQLTDLIRERSLQKVAIILDCCYAGRAVEGASRGAVEEQVRSAVEPSGSGIFFLGASGKNQTAEEREIDGHGRLTKAIVDGLSSGEADIDNDGNVSAQDLATYVKKRLRAQNADQEPIEGGAFQGELILGSNRRKQLEISLLAIRQRLEESKAYFTKETFRSIEDYIDDITNGRLDQVLIDAKYLALNMYAAHKASVEQVAKAFWRSEAPQAVRETPGPEQEAARPTQEARRPIRQPEPPEAAIPIPDYWKPLLIKGTLLVIVGCLAGAFPLAPRLWMLNAIGWSFLVGGLIPLLSTMTARGLLDLRWWLLSAILAMGTGLVLMLKYAQTFATAVQVFVFFLGIEGVISILHALKHRREHLSTRWRWMLASGIVDLILGAIIPWALFFYFAYNEAYVLVGLSMLLSGVLLIAMSTIERFDRSRHHGAG